MTSSDPIKRAQSFATSFYSWFNSPTGMKGMIDDSRRRYRMILNDAKERKERNLSAIPSTKSTEVVDKAKEAALIEYHKDEKAISYSATGTQDPEQNKFAQWLSAVVHYRMNSMEGFPFFAWHDSSLKTAFVDGLEAAFVYWKKEAWTDSKTVYFSKIDGSEITDTEYKQLRFKWPDLRYADPTLPEFDTLYGTQTVKNDVVVTDTWWIRQLLPGENVLWDFKAPFLDPNSGSACLVKSPFSVDEVMNFVDKGVFDKIKREEVEQFRRVDSSSHQAKDTTAFGSQSANAGDLNTVEVWIYWEKIGFRWMVSFSLEGRKALTKKPKPSDDIFFNGRRVNRLPVVIGYIDKALNENMGRSLPQVMAPIDDQYTDHINNLNDLAKNIVRGGRIRLSPGTDVDIDQVMNGGAFKAEQGEVEFIQYNPGIMESMRAADMHSAAINAVAPVGVTPVNIAPKGTNKTLGASQMIQGMADGKRYVQLMLRNQTFFKPLLWLIAQLEFAYESNEKALRIAAAKVTDFKVPLTMDRIGQAVVDLSKFDADVDVQINAGLGEMADVEKFNNLFQFRQFCQQIGVNLDPLVMAQLGASLNGFALDRFKPKPPPSNVPPPKLDSKLTVAANWVDLPPQVQMMLLDKWEKGQVATDTKIDAQMNEMMHNQQGAPAGPAPDMTQGQNAAAMSAGGQIGGMGGR